MTGIAVPKKVTDRINESLILVLILVVVLAFVFGYVANDLNEARQSASASPVQECLELALSPQHHDTFAHETLMERIAACIEFVQS